MTKNTLRNAVLQQSCCAVSQLCPMNTSRNAVLQQSCCAVSQLCPTLCTPWAAPSQASLSFTISQSLLKFTSIESVILFNHLSLCCLLLLLCSIFQIIRVFSNGLAFCIRWQKYWNFSFSIGPSNEYSGLVFFRIDWFELLAVQGTLNSSPAQQFERINSLALSLLYGQGFPGSASHKEPACQCWRHKRQI